MTFLRLVAAVLLSAVWADALLIPKASAEKSESDLRKDLFQNYDKLVRPATDPEQSTPLQVSLSPLRILELDSNKMVLVVDTWVLMRWADNKFQWDPKDYSDIEYIVVPNSEVWKPDLSLYTATPDTALFPSSESRVLIYSNGTVLWVPMFTVRSSCPMSPIKSTIMCNVRMGSWTYSGALLNMNLINPGIDLSNFMDINTDWKLMSAVSSKESKFYPCCVEDYPLLHFNFTLKKRSGSFNNEIHPHFDM